MFINVLIIDVLKTIPIHTWRLKTRSWFSLNQPDNCFLETGLANFICILYYANPTLYAISPSEYMIRPTHTRTPLWRVMSLKLTPIVYAHVAAHVVFKTTVRVRAGVIEIATCIRNQFRTRHVADRSSIHILPHEHMHTTHTTAQCWESTPLLQILYDHGVNINSICVVHLRLGRGDLADRSGGRGQRLRSMSGRTQALRGAWLQGTHGARWLLPGTVTIFDVYSEQPDL